MNIPNPPPTTASAAHPKNQAHKAHGAHSNSMVSEDQIQEVRNDYEKKIAKLKKVAEV
jgi:hypothetical protein